MSSTVELRFEDYAGPVEMPAGGCEAHPESFSVVSAREPRAVLTPCYQCWKNARVQSRNKAAEAARLKVETERAVLSAAVEWREVDARLQTAGAQIYLDGAPYADCNLLGVQVDALRSAVDALVRARGEAEGESDA